jgi:hypothetical protein
MAKKTLQTPVPIVGVVPKKKGMPKQQGGKKKSK